MTTDLFTTDLGKLSPDELFNAISEFACAQPSEGWRHDYAAEWGDSALKDVAGFANTFGGLLIIGVRKEKNDIHCVLDGVDCPVEYKTRIASSIASNISPTPSYDIYECQKPGEPGKRFCVIRVRGGHSLYLVTKKGIDPVYVRNEDESRPADSSQLRNLIDRARLASERPENMRAEATQLIESLFVGRGYVKYREGTWTRSDTFLRMALVPGEVAGIHLDSWHERRLAALVGGTYPRVTDAAGNGVATFAEDRGAEFYEHEWYHRNLDYEMRWRITSSGSLGHVTQTRTADGSGTNEVWSIVDVAIGLALFLKLSAQWWADLGYFGEGRLSAQVSVPRLRLARSGTHGDFLYAFDPLFSGISREKPASMHSGAIRLTNRPRAEAAADISLNYSSLKERAYESAARVGNLLLRGLGHAADLEALKEDLRPRCEALL